MSLAEALSVQETAQPGSASAFGVLFGRYMRPDQQEFPCQLHSIDATQVTVITRGDGDFGERLVLYLDEIGRLEGEVIHRTSTGFTLGLALSPPQADRLQERLDWLRSRSGDEAGGEAQRRHARYQPSDTASQISLPDGRSYPCEIIDISVSGAAVRVDVIPAVGSYVMIGKMRGRVTRIHSEGVGIEFVKMLDTEGLKSSFSF